jgi:hypothetical protein
MDQGRTTLSLSVKNSLYDANDSILVVWGYSTANSSNNGIAQTALIPIGSFSGSFANSFATYLQIPVQQPDPSNSTSLTSTSQGQMFASNSYLYVASGNSHLLRVALSAF